MAAIAQDISHAQRRPAPPLSRYRSVRTKAQDPQPAQVAPIPTQPLAAVCDKSSQMLQQAPAMEQSPSIQRSMSRYRKAPRVGLSSPSATQAVTTTNTLPAHIAPSFNCVAEQESARLHSADPLLKDHRTCERNGEFEGMALLEQQKPTSVNGISSERPRSVEPEAVRNDSSQIPHVVSPGHLQRSRSRYRKPAKPASALDVVAATEKVNQPITTSRQDEREHGESVQSLETQASFQSQQSFNPLHPPLSPAKSSLDRVLEAREENNEEQLDQPRPNPLQDTLDQSTDSKTSRAPRADIDKAKDEARKIFDTENNKPHQQMQEKTVMKGEKDAATGRPSVMPKQTEAAGESTRERRDRVKQQPSPSDGKDRFAFLRKFRPGDGSRSRPSTNNNREINGEAHRQNNISQGGGSIVSSVDAPISAADAGGREVRLEYNGSSIFLPVTPSATPAELIRAASTSLNESINLNDSVLLESFSKVGIQRPLRYYEHIGDVMNSWDEDLQNSLILMPSSTCGQVSDLDSTSVATDRPDEFSCHLFYSQKPGKWVRKWVTLRSDGQIVCAKERGHKEIINACHMSDFDIYTLGQRQSAKRTKPPKEICFAIKSQQRSTMFLNENNFVHFFCTDDQKTATNWYKAVQGWRSWYLVNVMGKGVQPPPKSRDNNSETTLSETGSSQKPGSQGVDPYHQLGSFEPQINRDRFSFSSSGLSGNTSEQSGASHSQNGRSKTNVGPTSSFKRRSIAGSTAMYTQDTNGVMHQSTEDDTFAPTGLLGRSYSTRQQAYRDRRTMRTNDGPFTGGLLDSQPISKPVAATGRAPLDPNNAEAGGLSRSASTARHGKPLLDLTPSYPEPPQHSHKGRGFVPEQVGPRGLIDSATSPDIAVQIPPATDWRIKPPSSSTGSAPPGSGYSSELGRNRSVRRQQEAPNPGPFTGDGLLGSSPSGWGGATTGRGVMDGSKVRAGPMLNVHETSNFASGSLLRKVESEETARQPVISREKGMEVVIETGEGV